ncbi:hypothetical protein [Sphingobium sp. JAI105]|uniref:hypothetical protein n=1 Tax=Sphingobium sp. JAI105 TaxID=2787715 RepID=UPI0018CB53AE|nr:hypothetical protein [Sphingobium sp. JAI105]
MTDPIADLRATFAPCLAEVEGALARREEQYPALVQAGRMDHQASTREIEIWRAIVADWRRVVTGVGPVGTQATVPEKIDQLKDGIARYGPALGREIATLSDSIRQDCLEIPDRAYLADRHGHRVARYIELLTSRDRLMDLAILYNSELPSSPLWRGFWRGIDAYLSFHQDARTTAKQREAT